MDSRADWAQAASQFQQNLGEGWKKALESFQSMSTGSHGAAQALLPALGFAP
ncbi:MAG: hypothetical protein RIS88_2334, partial [Pseudomonadota bacterium]